MLRVDGFVNSQVSWYANYSPRYAFTFLVNVVELAGPPIVPVLPTLAITTAVGVTTWTLMQLRMRFVAAVVCAEGVVLATLYSAPDLGQSLYWQTGMLTYLLPLVLCTFLIGWIVSAVRHRQVTLWAVAISGLVTFVAGGLSEAYLVPQNVGLTLSALAALGLLRGATRRVLLTHLLAAMAGGVLALLVILVAPATASRVGGSPADLWLALSAAIATAAYQILRLGRYFGPAVALCALVPGALGALAAIGRAERASVNRTWFVTVTVLVGVTLPFCYFPSFYAQNGNPPARSLIVPGAMLTGYLLFVGYAIAGVVARWLRSAHRLAPSAAAIVLTLIPLGIAATSLDERAQAAEYAALWDAEDAAIRAGRDAGQTDLTVPRLPIFLGEKFVGPDRRDWFNTCVARYYGVSSIAAPE